MKSLPSCVCFGYHKSLGQDGDCESCSSSQWKTWIHPPLLARARGRVVCPLGRQEGGTRQESWRPSPPKSVSEVRFALQASVLSSGESFAGASKKWHAGDHDFSCAGVAVDTGLYFCAYQVSPAFYSALNAFLGFGVVDSSKHRSRVFCGLSGSLEQAGRDDVPSAASSSGRTKPGGGFIQFIEERCLCQREMLQLSFFGSRGEALGRREE